MVRVDSIVMGVIRVEGALQDIGDLRSKLCLVLTFWVGRIRREPIIDVMKFGLIDPIAGETPARA
jgi:hypothetical protein